jgi:hypothetical protein
MGIGKGIFKRVWQKGRVISRTNDNEYIIETFPNQSGSNKAECEDCGRIGAEFIRVYMPQIRFKVYHKVVCPACCESEYA